MKNIPVDLVILWVNGNDPAFVLKRNEWASRLGMHVSAACFVQTDELKYVLRSAEKFLPWITRIVLVTNGQKLPDWLETNHYRLKILTHKEFMLADCLPTFNSCAIETGCVLWRGLAEHFLMANDDTFIFRPLPYSYFFKRGRAVNYFVEYPRKNYLLSSYGRQLLNIQKLLKGVFAAGDFPLEPYHNIMAYKKTACVAAWKKFFAVLADTRASRFRLESNANMFIFAGVAAALGKAVWQKSRRQRWLPSDGLVWELWQNYEDEIKKYRPKLVCLNDSDLCTDGDRRKLSAFLEKIFPSACSFEKTTRGAKR